jgi:ubiquinone/menaquinone biosynthesis C-methylase UbiE
VHSAWLDIPLSDYEGHMASVGQAQLLANALSGFVELHRPPSLAVIGCAGGNGLERVSPTVTSRLVAVDANPAYVHVARERFAHRFRQFEAVVGDAQSEAMTFMPVAAAFAGLVFEYVSPSALLRQLARWIHPGGHIGVVLQLPSSSMDAVSPSPFLSLKKLVGCLRLVAPEEFVRLAGGVGFEKRRECAITLETGKSFWCGTFERTT